MSRAVYKCSCNLIPGLIEYECGECGKSFDLDDDLQSHIDREHAICFVLNDRYPPQTEQENIPVETHNKFCGRKICDKKLRKPSAVQLHMET
ncbi:hypothetical protein ACTXT7_008572, partial [Hymenolepis weldensis]